MLVGHLAAGLVGKRVAPKISLGTLVLAAVAADLLWCVFLITGIEQVRFVPAATTQNSLQAIHIPYSHGLLLDLVWAGLFAGAYLWRRHFPRGARVLFAAVVSHWVLDCISHKPDMPLAPGVAGRFGLGLWNSIPATVAVEGGFWAVALFLYARGNKPRNRAGVYAFWGGVVLVTAAWYNNVAGPPPAPNVVAAGMSSLVFFSLIVAWAYWMNQVRAVPAPS